SYIGGIGMLSFTYVRGFLNSNPRRLSIWVNGVQWGATITVSPRSDLPIIFSGNINITGPATLELRASGSQILIDDISWTAASTTTADWCNLQSPQNGNITVGNEFNVYAQVYKAGV